MGCTEVEEDTEGTTKEGTGWEDLTAGDGVEIGKEVSRVNDLSAGAEAEIEEVVLGPWA